MIPEESEEFPLLLVGAGKKGHAWIEALAMRPTAARGAFLAGICDPRPGVTAAALGLPEAVLAADLEEAIAAAAPRGVLLATPPETRPGLARALLRRGLPVLCEGPLALDEEGARAMLQNAWEARTPLWLASAPRFAADLRRGAELARSGVLGEPLCAWIEWAGSQHPAGRPLAEPRRPALGVVAEEGARVAELARLFLGPVSGAAAFALPRPGPGRAEESASLSLRHAGGALTSVFLSRAPLPCGPWYYRLEGSEGRLLAGWREARYKLHEAPDWVVFGRGLRAEAALAAMAGAFADALRGQADFPVTAAEAFATVAVTAAAARALESGRLEVVSEEAQA